nr:Na+/H+ antiporter NhaA [Diaminobutyricimonas aerilata]
MRFLRSERYSAVLLLAAAAAGLLLANTAAGPGLTALRDTYLDIPPLGIHLTVGHWVTDGLLAIFFFLAAIELRHELTRGELDSARKALVPTIAAVGGVVVPAIVFLLVVHDAELQNGWPIPTATDIAFALGVLAVVGRGLPSRIRALLLALAVIDDLIAILIIAMFFTEELLPLPLLLAVPVVLLFGWISRRTPRGSRIALLVALGVLAWYLVLQSGVHATIAGVALGLIMAPRTAAPARHAMEPWSNLIVLPVFAFVAALVALPAVSIDRLSPVFWGIVLALPLGKLVGITGAAFIATRLSRSGRRPSPLPLGDILVVASLGGIGFTVSLLMNELAFESSREVAAEGTIAVILGSLISAVVAIVLTSLRARRYRRRARVL